MPPYFTISDSGDRCLVLEDDVDYDGFASAVERWSDRFGIQVLHRSDGPDARVWECESRGQLVCFVFDDLLADVRLKAQHVRAIKEVDRIAAALGVERPNA